MLQRALSYMYTWSIAPVFHLNMPDYWNHLTSQMYFYNIIPSPSVLNPNLTSNHYQVDLSIPLERREEGLKIAKKKFPKYKSYFPTTTRHGNQKEGRVGVEGARYSCETAWKIYDYYMQDFVCLGYEMPKECLKEECKPTGYDLFKPKTEEEEQEKEEEEVVRNKM